MKTTTVSYLVHVTYESDCDLDEGDLQALRAELESSLHNANSTGELIPPGRAIDSVTLEVNLSGCPKAS